MFASSTSHCTSKTTQTSPLRASTLLFIFSITGVQKAAGLVSRPPLLRELDGPPPRAEVRNTWRRGGALRYPFSGWAREAACGQVHRGARRSGYRRVSLVAADRVFQDDAGWVKSTPKALFVRENVGFDFAYWAHILRGYIELYNREIVYLLNDSLFGPVNDDAFAAMITKVRASSADVVGLTENLERGWHVQSYFLAVKKGALGSYAFHNFVLGVRSHQDIDDVISAYEITFASRMREAGLAVEAVYEVSKIRDPTVYHWRELLDEGFPFLKVKVARDDLPGVDKSGWRKTLIVSAMTSGSPMCVLRSLRTLRQANARGAGRL